jgi:Cdc6-like AAA superfamily ATPase
LKDKSAKRIMSQQEPPSKKDIQLQTLATVFTPSSPILSQDLFFGRYSQLNKIVDAINERGQHAVLYGDRGVGKTSLANIVKEKLLNIVIAKVTCNRTESFKDIWQKAFKQITLISKRDGVGFTALPSAEPIQLDLFLPQAEEIDSSDILAALSNIKNSVLCIFDEFDSVKNPDTLLRFADTVKALSDNAPFVTLLMVGIAQDVNDLIGSHPSNDRCIKQIKLPRMSPIELAEIIDNGVQRLGMTIDREVKADIVNFSNGFPHYTHLLAKYSARIAIDSQSDHIDRQHFDLAVDDAIDNAQEFIRDMYQKAVLSYKSDAIFNHIIAACAIVQEDEYGTFGITDIEEPLNKMTGKQYSAKSFSYHVGKMCEEERGMILEKVKLGKLNRYKFTNPLLKAFVKIKLYQKQLASQRPIPFSKLLGDS